MRKTHFRIAALQCNFQTEEQTLNMPKLWHDYGFDTEQLLHTHADLYSAVYDPKRHQKLMRDYLKRSSENGIDTIVYMNCHILGPSLQEYYDDWAVIDENGKKTLLYETYPACCVCTPWRQYFYSCIESLAEFKIAGIFFDGPAYPDCRCKACQEECMRLTNKRIETLTEAELLAFKKQKVLLFKQELYAKVKSVNPKWISYFNEGLFSGRMSSNEMKAHLKCNDLIGTEGGFFFYNEPRSCPYWHCAVSAKMAESLSEERPTVIFFAGDHKPWGWYMHTVTETKLCYISALANGASVWYGLHCNPENLTETKTGAAAREMIAFDQKYETIYENSESIANTAIFYSFDTAFLHKKSNVTTDFYSSEKSYSNHPGDYSRSVNGAFAMLEHLNIPYDIVNDLEPKKMLKYKTLLVPCAAMLKNEVVATMRKFVENGGFIIADGEFGRYDEHGKSRVDNSVSDITGGEINDSLLNLGDINYMSVNSECFKVDNAFGYMPSPAWAFPVKASATGEVVVRTPQVLHGRYEREPGKAVIPIGTKKISKNGVCLYIAGGFFEFYEGYHIDSLRNWIQAEMQNRYKNDFALINGVPGISMTVRKTQDNSVLIHLSNYVGATRPLSTAVAISGLKLQVPGFIHHAKDLLTAKELDFDNDGLIELPMLNEFCVIILN